MPRPKHYDPPEPSKLDRFAHDVCRDYAVNKSVYCAHCEKQAQEQDDPRLWGRLTEGPDARKKRCYKHKPGVVYGVTNRKVPADIIEAEFGRPVGSRQSRQGLCYLDLRGWGVGAIRQKASQKWESFSRLASRSLPLIQPVRRVDHG